MIFFEGINIEEFTGSATQRDARGATLDCGGKRQRHTAFGGRAMRMPVLAGDNGDAGQKSSPKAVSR